MAVYRRREGKIWWYEFQFQGRRIRESSGCTNKAAGLRAEAKRKADLVDRRAGFSQAKLAPKFEEFVEKFLAWSKQQHRPKTRELHGTNCDTLLRFFRGCWLDEITQGMVEDFKLARIGEARRNARDGFVFPAKGGIDRPIGSVRKAHDAAVERADIKEHFRLYDLRHTFATRAVAAGVDLPTLSAILGHTSIQMTMRYVHPAEEQKKIAARKLEDFRITGIVQAMEKSQRVPTMGTVN